MALSWKSSAPLGATLELSCNKGTVVVGLELYSAPPEDAWKPYKDASGESARCGRSGDDPCPEPGLVCSNTVCGQWVATASGACLGIGGLYCADAAAVAAGANPKPVYVPLAGGGIGGNRDLVFARPGAYALSAVDIAYLPKGGATQLTVYDRPFTHASATLTALIASPPKPTPGQKVTRLNCAASPGGGGPFPPGLSQALTRPADGDEFSSLGALGLRCSDYRDVLSPGADLLGCCLGRVKQGCAEFAPQGAKCDAAIAAYCRGSGADPAGCGCFTSPLAGGGGRPQCYDSRCAPGNAEAASAYRPRSLPIASCASLLKQPLSCDIWEALGRGKHLAKGVTVPPACAGGGADWFHANRGLLLFLLLCLVIGGVAFAVHRSHRRPPIPPPPPAEG